ncbi:hypothetical protein [Legionella sp. 16cNR16C]|uniref:hypothetical protein n=1 Tax=Legionella sp. 16cNR16C TaxID=2905656 RepID=UPI001E34C53A|nr:hypothetical protein [Legionella sp. 16cNR16C]MCE3045961.1 hypothetical protein [Legionella sp. 16cNR16C]
MFLLPTLIQLLLKQVAALVAKAAKVVKAATDAKVAKVAMAAKVVAAAAVANIFKGSGNASFFF